MFEENEIGDEGATSIGEALKINRSLRTLHLKCNFRFSSTTHCLKGIILEMKEQHPLVKL